MTRRIRRSLLREYKRDQGGALIIVVLIVVAMTLLGSIGYDLTIHRRKQVVAVKKKSQALQLAEAAIDDVRVRMLPTYDLESTIMGLSVGTSASTTGGLTGDECMVTIEKMGAETFKMASTYPSTGIPVRKVNVVVEADYGSVFHYAACGCSSLEVSGTTDSYSSDNGTYASQTPGDDGDVGSNGWVKLKGLVDGNLEAGTDIHADSNSDGIVTGYGTLGGVKADGANCGPKSCVQGTLLTNVTPTPMPCDCSSFDVAGLVTAGATTNNNGSLPAPYTSATSLNMSGNEELVISSGGTYYFTSVVLAGNSKITIATTDTVVFALAGPGLYDFAGNGIVNGSDNAKNLQIYSTYTGDIIFRGGSEFSALVYAPYANIRLEGNFDVYGAFLGNVFVGVGTTDVHYDEIAEDLDMVIDNYKIKSWMDDRNI